MPRIESLSNRPWIIAHRGARAEAPENTAAAFNRALDYSIDGVELDVQMSADGAAVLYHDRTLKKIAGTRRRVADLTWTQLQQLDAGAWFAPRFAGERMLGFDRMLELLVGRTRLFIEIKVFEADRRSGRALRLTEKVLETLAADRWAAYRDSFLILSFDADILRYAGDAAPGLQLVLDVSRTGAKRLMRTPEDLLERLTAFCVHTGGVTRRLVEWTHGLGKLMFTYTCNDPAMFETLSAAGTAGILTDDPARIAGRQPLA